MENPVNDKWLGKCKENRAATLTRFKHLLK